MVGDGPQGRGSLSAPPYLRTVVEQAAVRHARRVAFVAPARWSLTYHELDRVVAEAAARLARHGVGPGALVALVLPSSVDYLVAYLATARLGAATVGVNPRAPAAERSHVLAGVVPDLVVGTAELLDGVRVDAPVVEVALATGPFDLLTSLGPAADHEPGEDRLAAATPAGGDGSERPVAVVLTSGTSGAPKAAVFGDRQLRAIAAMDVGGRHDGGGPMLASTELVHVGVMTKLAWYLRTGATLHLLPRWRAGAALDVIERERIGVLGAISAQVALLLRDPDLDRRDLSHVQALVVGGGPSPAAMVQEARRRFAAAYSIRYSSTESGGVGTGTAFDAPEEEALHTVGRPRDGVEVVLRDDGGRLLVEPGAEGEVWLRSPAVMAGYWRNADATASTLVHGWLRTRDRACWDDRGCLRLLGRADDVIIRGGYNVHPQPVEAAVRSHPGVAEVAVVGTPDDVMGEVVTAVVVPRHPTAPPRLEDLRAHVVGHLAHHEVPQRLVVVDALPRTAMGKVDRRSLRAAATA